MSEIPHIIPPNHTPYTTSRFGRRKKREKPKCQCFRMKRYSNPVAAHGCPWLLPCCFRFDPVRQWWERPHRLCWAFPLKSLFTVRFNGEDEDWIWLRMIDRCILGYTKWVRFGYCTLPSQLDASSQHLPRICNLSLDCLEAPRVERLWAARWVVWHLPPSKSASPQVHVLIAPSSCAYAAHGSESFSICTDW
jgi:hypothetical protein